MIDLRNPHHSTDVPLILLGVVLIIIILFFSSCSAEWHIRRAISKNPNLLKTDTIRVRDTIVVQQISYDTTIISKPIDTILITKERLRIKITRMYDTLRVEGVCLADTIFYEKKIPYKKIEYKPRAWYDRYWWLILLVCGALIYFKK